jgi:hypothetical protein
LNASPAVVPRARRTPEREPLTARAYPDRLPDDEYFGFCTHVYHHQHSRNYGERVYLDFQIYLGEHAGKTVRMFLRPSIFPTSNFYRSWAIAHGGPPKSRNTKMSARIFKGKLFRLLTTTVKPKHRIGGDDGKLRPGPFLPESFWYSKVACLLSLEASNEHMDSASTAGGFAPPDPRAFLTNLSENPFSGTDLSEGRVGRRELGDGSKRERDLAVRDGKTVATLRNQPAGKAASMSAPSPKSLMPPKAYTDRRAELERQKQILRERGFLDATHDGEGARPARKARLLCQRGL